jgi:hypothetical protein
VICGHCLDARRYTESVDQDRSLSHPGKGEEAMRLSSLILGTIVAVAVIGVLLWFSGVIKFERPVTTTQGAALYNRATETTVKGDVQELSEFDCPVSEGEIGSHLTLMTADGALQIHLAPARIMRSHQMRFAPGDQLEVVGSAVRIGGKEGVIAREVTRGNESFVLRDPDGRLMLVQ